MSGQVAVSAAPQVLLQSVGCAGVITLNRPRALNALNLDMIRLIYAQLKRWESAGETDVVVIKGAAGGRAFCAGGDVRATSEAWKSGDPAVARNFFRELCILNNAIGNYKKPYVALVDGITMGAGVGLSGQMSARGQFRIATERTVYASPEAAIGLFPAAGGGYFLPRLQGKLGLFLAMTGFRLNGRDVQRVGVASHFVESRKIPDLEKDLVQMRSPTSEDVYNLLDGYQCQSGLDYDKPFALAQREHDIDTLFSAGSVEEIFHNLSAHGTTFAARQIATLSKMSPTSLKIIFKQLRAGASLSLREVLEMEFRLSQACMRGSDFHEGVRAALIDKDRSPQWRPSSLRDVTDVSVERCFSSLGDEDLRL